MGIQTTFGGNTPLRMGRVLLRSWVNIIHRVAVAAISETPKLFSLWRWRALRAVHLRVRGHLAQNLRGRREHSGGAVIKKSVFFGCRFFPFLFYMNAKSHDLTNLWDMYLFVHGQSCLEGAEVETEAPCSEARREAELTFPTPW